MAFSLTFRNPFNQELLQPPAMEGSSFRPVSGCFAELQGRHIPTLTPQGCVQLCRLNISSYCFPKPHTSWDTRLKHFMLLENIKQWHLITCWLLHGPIDKSDLAKEATKEVCTRAGFSLPISPEPLYIKLKKKSAVPQLIGNGAVAGRWIFWKPGKALLLLGKWALILPTGVLTVAMVQFISITLCMTKLCKWKDGTQL